MEMGSGDGKWGREGWSPRQRALAGENVTERTKQRTVYVRTSVVSSTAVFASSPVSAPGVSRGKVSMKVQPWPTWLLTHRSPPCLGAISRETYRPRSTPRLESLPCGPGA